jgi:hypothetical protein
LIGFQRAPYFSLDDEDGVGIAEFATDDGAKLREGVSNLGQRLAAAASGAGGKDLSSAPLPQHDQPELPRGSTTPTALPTRESGGDESSYPDN